MLDLISPQYQKLAICLILKGKNIHSLNLISPWKEVNELQGTDTENELELLQRFLPQHVNPNP